MNGPADDMDSLADDDFGGKVETPDEHTVNYVFPVTIVLVGALSEDDCDVIEKRIWTGFNDALFGV